MIRGRAAMVRAAGITGRRFATATALMAGLLVMVAAIAAPPAGAVPAADAPLADDLPPEVRQRIIEAAIVEAMRDGLYFSDRIRERLDRDDSLREYAMRAATLLGIERAEALAAVRRADTVEGRTALRSLLPEEDDAEAIRRLVRRDLLRAAAPLPDEKPVDDHGRARAVVAAKRLLVEQMRVPGGTVVWGDVDDELDRKIRMIVASRAPRADRRVWCELAAWTMLAQGLNGRAVGMAEESAHWLANASRPPSADFAVVSILAQKHLTTLEELRMLADRRRAAIDADPDLRARLDRALGREPDR